MRCRTSSGTTGAECPRLPKARVRVRLPLAEVSRPQELPRRILCQNRRRPLGRRHRQMEIPPVDAHVVARTAQRLLIARAIVHQPRILFFDEATSALDNRTQAIVSASMEQLHATRIVIAHRLSTIMNADRIYVLERGKIVQSGSYQQLMEQDGPFADLARRQLA